MQECTYSRLAFSLAVYCTVEPFQSRAEWLFPVTHSSLTQSASAPESDSSFFTGAEKPTREGSQERNIKSSR